MVNKGNEMDISNRALKQTSADYRIGDGGAVPELDRRSVSLFSESFASALRDQLPFATALECMQRMSNAGGVVLCKYDKATKHTSVLRKVGVKEVRMSLENVPATKSVRLVLWQDKYVSEFILAVFRDKPTHLNKTVLLELGKVAAQVWSESKHQDPAGSPTQDAVIHPDKQKPVLGPDNPFGLSRSEFRVCTLIGQGQKAADIARTLDVSIATVRSHLKGIYSKTDLSGQFDVLHRLHTDKANLRTSGQPTLGYRGLLR